MGILGTLLFVFVFLMITEKTHVFIGAALAATGQWFASGSPWPIAIAIAAIIVPAIAVLILMKWRSPSDEEQIPAYRMEPPDID